MRWYVETSSIGKSDPAEKVCIEAAGWQQALQSVRSRRGDDGSFASFSIELLDDGYRAIDPATRTRFVIHRAPDDAPVTAAAQGATPAEPAGAAVAREADAARDLEAAGEAAAAGAAAPTSTGRRAAEAASAAPAAAGAAEAAAPAPARPRGDDAAEAPGPVSAAPVTTPSAAHEPARPKQRISIPDDVVPRASAPPQSSPPIAAAAPSAAPQSPARRPSAPPGGGPTQMLVAHRVASERAREPTAESPLTYREVALIVAPATPNEELEALLRARFEAIRGGLADRKHRYVLVAVFDHDFHGSPDKMPVATLSWKDWRSPEPEVRFMGEEAPPPSVVASMGLHGLRRASAAPPPAPPEPAPSAPATVPRSADSIARGAAAMAGEDEPTIVKPDTFDDEASIDAAPAGPVDAAPAAPAPPPAPASTPPVAQPPAPASTPPASPPQAAASTPPASLPPASLPPASLPPAAASTPPASLAPASLPPSRETMTPPSVPQGERVKGDELLSELFDASGDLGLVHDPLDGADFVLALALSKIPCEAGLVSFFDMNKRAFVVVRQRGGKKKVLLATLPEKNELANRVMRGRRAVVLPRVAGELEGDPRWSAAGVEPRTLACAPILQGGRYLGLVELANPADGQPFDDDDGNALEYLAQQLAEFLGSRTISVDAEAVKKPPLRSRMR